MPHLQVKYYDRDERVRSDKNTMLAIEIPKIVKFNLNFYSYGSANLELSLKTSIISEIK